MSATTAYLNSEDLLGQWLDEVCEADPAMDWKWESVAALFASWSDYAVSAGEKPTSKKAFSQAMQDRGFRSAQQGHLKTRSFRGVQLKTPAAENHDV